MTHPTRISIIGAGNVGGSLGRTFSKAGFTVRFGVRPGTDTTSLLEDCGKSASASDPAAAAAWGDVVFLSVPGTVALDVARSLADELDGKVVVDCNAEAKKVVAEVAVKAGFTTVDAGPLRNAAVLENVAMLWIHLATVGGQGRDFAFALQRPG